MSDKNLSWMGWLAMAVAGLLLAYWLGSARGETKAHRQRDQGELRRRLAALEEASRSASRDDRTSRSE
jgi:hypothetical protein